MKACQNPAHGRRHDDGARDLRTGCTQYLRIGDQRAVGFAHALKRVGEYDEENHDDGQRHLGCHAEAKRNNEDRTQHDARDGIGDLDIDREHIGEELVATQQDAANDAADRTDKETKRGFLKRYDDLFRKRSL